MWEFIGKAGIIIGTIGALMFIIGGGMQFWVNK